LALSRHARAQVLVGSTIVKNDPDFRIAASVWLQNRGKIVLVFNSREEAQSIVDSLNK
jgi:hypothetical protein